MKEKKKKNGKNTVKVPDRKKLVRDQRISIALNDAEMRALQRYFQKYKITNKTKFCRELIMLEVLRKFEADAPTLFDNVDEP